METSARYLSAREAADRLGISLATLYAYVSRGLLRSEAGAGETRARRYYAEDVEALLERKEYRREPYRAAESALNYGAPVLESAITLIQAGRLYYRGYDALTLAQQQSVEATAALIWLDRLDAGDLFSRAATSAPPPTIMDVDRHPIAAYQIALARAAVDDLAAYLTTPEAVAATGARILTLLVMCTTNQPVTTSLAHALQRAWMPAQPEAATLLSAALILCADHELNVSAFAARSVASAGATPYDVVIAGLAALHGHRHGGHTARVAALLRSAADDLPGAVKSCLARGETLPGFGHRLYPDGDPRARLLLTLTATQCPNAPVVQLAQSLCTLVQQTLALQPTIDFALEVMAQALALPPAAALAIFALGRTIGWIGHASEQYATGQLIRPRARYTGRQAAS
ncbi:MAG TPA: hypothetical protein DCL15_18985 [Chloroflexi bacterium]|nr:hypothetical protein [Chloroflexota bacterium]HHW87496.1 helix-turn-helix domain-containing protein [Chloroflexota bacterium]